MMPGSIPSLASVGPPPKQTTGKANKGKKKGGNHLGLSDPRPYNHYNLYFILERELFLQGRGVYPSPNADAGNATDVDYSGLVVPSLPPRYENVMLTPDWYVHRRKKRAHVKTHGILSFREMAAMVASRWKDEDKEIVEFVKTVADRVKRRYDDHKLLPLQAAVMRCHGVVRENPAERARFMGMMKMMNQGPLAPTSSSMMQSSMMRGGPMSMMNQGQGQGPISSSNMGPSSPMNNLLSSPVQSARQTIQANQAMGSNMSLPFQRTPQHHSPQRQQQVQPMRCSSDSSPYMGMNNGRAMTSSMMCRGVSQGSDAVVNEMVNEMMMCGAASQGTSNMASSRTNQCPTSSQAMLGRGDSRGSEPSATSSSAAANANIASVDMGDDEIFAMWSDEQVGPGDFFF